MKNMNDMAIVNQARDFVHVADEGSGVRISLPAGSLLLSPASGGVLVSRPRVLPDKVDALAKSITSLSNLTGTVLFADPDDRMSRELIGGIQRIPDPLPVFIIMSPGVYRDPDMIESLGEDSTASAYNRVMGQISQRSAFGHVVLYHDRDARFIPQGHRVWMSELLADARKRGRGAVEVTSDPKLAKDVLYGPSVIEAVKTALDGLSATSHLGEMKIIGLTMDSQVLRAEFGKSSIEDPGF